ncbi:hypothetical protein [Nocardia sp. NBC_00511]|uniref:hypothetical protein n=1 Tax=Nocardia sp. NBC_00511 TaxID=2903591 RepID=UPI0030E47CD5
MSELDHLVLATPDLAATVAHLTQLLRVAPIAGTRPTLIATIGTDANAIVLL